MLKDLEIDIISICLPSAMHAEYAVRAMEAIKSVRIVNAIYESARTGKTIYFE